MNILKKTVKEVPNYLERTLSNTNDQIYKEQLRVKEFSNKISVRKGTRKAVIPWSGGLDSTTSLLMALESGLEVKTINVNYGQTYYDKEFEHIKSLSTLIEDLYPESWKDHLEVDISWLNSKLKRRFKGEWKHIFPFRNYIILEEAAKHIENKYSEIWFGCVQGEIPFSGGDKSAIFLTTMKETLGSRDIQLVLPLIAMNKSDILNWAVNEKKTRFNIIYHTISCFNGEGIHHCGECKSCFNRAVAFHSAGMVNKCGFKPQKESLRPLVESYKKKLKEFDHYSPIRRKQINNFINYIENL